MADKSDELVNLLHQSVAETRALTEEMKALREQLKAQNDATELALRREVPKLRSEAAARDKAAEEILEDLRRHDLLDED